MKPACRASEMEALLLRAALLPGEPGRQAWRAFRATADLNALDSSAHRLLPLLYQRLNEEKIQDAWLPRLQGVWKMSWIRGEQQRRQLAQALAVLRVAGVEAMLLKGSDLALRYYAHPALRPMGDVDLLVRPAQIGAALAALGKAGWKPKVRWPERWLEVWHSVECRGPKGVSIDLHGHLLPGVLATHADEGLWEKSEALDVLGEPARVLAPGDLLLHICAHGADWNEVSPVRWLADAWMVLRSAGERLDWERLALESAARRRLPALLETLEELRHTLEAPVPDEALQALRKMPLDWSARLEYRLASRPAVPVVGWLLLRFLEWRQWRREPDRPQNFAYFKARDWDLASERQLPAEVLRRITRRLGLRSAGKSNST